MMFKEKSNLLARLKYICILPMVALAVTAFARPELSGQLNEVSNSNQSLTDTVSQKIEVIARDTTVSVNRSAKHPLFLIDGKEASQEELSKIDPNAIKSVSVLKDKSATSMYGAKGVDGVVLIEMKDSKSSETRNTSTKQLETPGKMK